MLLQIAYECKALVPWPPTAVGSGQDCHASGICAINMAATCGVSPSRPDEVASTTSPRFDVAPPSLHADGYRFKISRACPLAVIDVGHACLGSSPCISQCLHDGV
ncbi:hypothetical protein CGRA01v4_03317 [Colletotrichum graminicola]|nr:hypothetical protein CGRA01v4_03317 [Colletotrichum graminicola]